MGNCAGCANPERRYRAERPLPRQSPEPTRQNTFESPAVAKNGSKEQILYNVMQNYAQPSQMQPKLAASPSTEDPWKSRIVTRTVKKYIKKTTLKQEESLRKENITTDKPSFYVAQPIKIITAQSLDESIMARKNMTPSEHRERYKNQYRQQFCEESADLREFLGTTARKQSQPGTPLARRLNTDNISPYNDLEGSNVDNSRAHSTYLPRKMDKIRNKQLADIMELMEKDAETPGYVKDLRKIQGEDIKMNNFGKFQPVGSFQWFSLGKYLGQIRKEDGEETIDRGKIKPTLQILKPKQKSEHENTEKTVRTRPALKILTQEDDPSLPISLEVRAK